MLILDSLDVVLEDLAVSVPELLKSFCFSLELVSPTLPVISLLLLEFSKLIC
jgi:hypothetical protein